MAEIVQGSIDQNINDLKSAPHEDKENGKESEKNEEELKVQRSNAHGGSRRHHHGDKDKVSSSRSRSRSKDHRRPHGHSRHSRERDTQRSSHGSRKHDDSHRASVHRSNHHSSRHHHSRRSLSTSKSPSPNRNKGRKSKQYRFDSPPKTGDFEGEGLAQYATTSGTAAQAALTTAQSLANQYNKVDRKLYIGNLPPGITSTTLVDLLNAALLQLKANIQEGGPVVSTWISQDGHYAFVEFRSAEEANTGFALNNISILGQALKVGRPKTYAGQPGMGGNLMGGMEPTIIPPDGPIIEVKTPAPPMMPPDIYGYPPPPPEMMGMGMDMGMGMNIFQGPRVQLASKVVVLKNIITLGDFERDEEYNDMVDEIREECSTYGLLASVIIPKPITDNPATEPGIGKVFLEFTNIEDAKSARKSLSGRKFSGKIIEASFYPENEYSERNYTIE